MTRAGAFTAVVAPLPEELAGVVNRTRVEEPGQAGLVCFARGWLAGVPVVVAATGDGRRAAERSLAELLDAVPVSRVLTLGVAGGLDPGLVASDLVVAERVLEAEGERLSEAPAPDGDWRGRVLAGAGEGALQLVVGTVVSVERVLADPLAKRALGRIVSDPHAVVDLETATYARVAAARGLPYLAIRAVLDPLDHPLPLDFSRLTGADGRVSRARVALAALRRPSVVPALLDLRRTTRSCARRLAAAAELAVAV